MPFGWRLGRRPRRRGRDLIVRINSDWEVLAVPPLFLQESGHSGGIPVDSGGMKFSRGLC